MKKALINVNSSRYLQMGTDTRVDKPSEKQNFQNEK